VVEAPDPLVVTEDSVIQDLERFSVKSIVSPSASVAETTMVAVEPGVTVMDPGDGFVPEKVGAVLDVVPNCNNTSRVEY
jgi:hypothetical protein